MSKVYNLRGEPYPDSELEAFKTAFNALMKGAEPDSEREKLLSEAIQVANRNVQAMGSPIESILTAWFAFMSTRRWVKGQTTQQGEALLSKTDTMLAQVVVTLLWEGWKALEGVGEINGQGELNVAGQEDEVAGGGEGAVRAVPSPESGPPN